MLYFVISITELHYSTITYCVVQKDSKFPQSEALLARSRNHNNQGRQATLATKVSIVTEVCTEIIGTMVTVNFMVTPCINNINTLLSN